MPFSSQPAVEQATRRDKRILAVAGLLIAAVIGGAAIWGAVRPGSYDRSHNGCVTVTVASTTGGAMLHQCGGAARATCRNAFAHADRLSLAFRSQCRLAGLGEPPPGPGRSGG